MGAGVFKHESCGEFAWRTLGVLFQLFFVQKIGRPGEGLSHPGEEMMTKRV